MIEWLLSILALLIALANWWAWSSQGRRLAEAISERDHWKAAVNLEAHCRQNAFDEIKSLTEQLRQSGFDASEVAKLENVLDAQQTTIADLQEQLQRAKSRGDALAKVIENVEAALDGMPVGR